MCCRITDMHEKEVINICDGRRLGCVDDVEVDTCTAQLVSLVIFGRAKVFGVLGREEDIVRLVLTGEVDEAPATAQLAEQLATFCWQLEVRDETRTRQDLWRGCGEDSLRGLFLQNLREEYEKADADGRAAIEQAVRFGLAAMENREL